MTILTVKKLIDEYYLSSDFNMLADKTKVDYKYFLGVMLDTSVDTKKYTKKDTKKYTKKYIPKL